MRLGIELIKDGLKSKYSDLSVILNNFTPMCRIILGFLLLFVQPLLYAQKAGLDSASSKKVSIEISNLTTAAQKANKLVVENQRRLDKYAEIAKISASLDDLDSQIVGLQNLSEKFDERSVSLQVILDLQDKWRRLAGKSKKVQNHLVDEQNRIDGYILEFEEEKLLWGLTKDDYISQEAPRRMVDMTTGILETLDGQVERLQDTLNAIYLLVDRNTKSQLALEQRIAALETEQNQTMNTLLTKSSDPYFQAINDSTNSVAIDEQMGELWSYSVREIVSFFKSNLTVTVYQGITSILLLLLLLFAKKRAIQSSAFQHSNTEALKGLLGSPISLTVLLSIYFTFLFYGSDLPTPAADILIIIIAAPFIYILPSIIGKNVLPFVWVLMVVFVSDQAQNLMFERPVLQRTVMLIESVVFIGAVGLIFYFRRGKLKEASKGSSWLTPILYGFALLVVVNLVSVYANLNGFVTLSSYLNRATIRTAVFVITSYTLFMIFKGLWTLLIMGSFSMEKSFIIQNHRNRILRGGTLLLKYYVIFFAIRSGLRQFRFYDEVLDSVMGVLELNISVGSTSIEISHILGFFVTLLISFYLASGLRVLLEEEILSRMKLERGVPMAISLMTKYTILTMGFFLAVSAAGIDLEKFGFIAGALGVGIGFGLQNVVGNFVAGLVLIFERPIHVGDIILMGTLEGTVTEIGIRATKIRTYDGAEVVIPNGDFISQQVTNWTLSDKQRRIEQFIEIDSKHDPRQVMDVLTKAIKQQENVLSEPQPMVIFQKIHENRHQYRLLFWVTGNILSTRTAVSVNIADKLSEAGIETAIDRTHVQLDDSTK